MFILPLNQTHSVVCPPQYVLPFVGTQINPTWSQGDPNPLEEELESGMHTGLNFKYDNILEYLKFRVICVPLYSSSTGLLAFSMRRPVREDQTRLCIWLCTRMNKGGQTIGRQTSLCVWLNDRTNSRGITKCYEGIEHINFIYIDRYVYQKKSLIHRCYFIIYWIIRTQILIFHIFLDWQYCTTLQWTIRTALCDELDRSTVSDTWPDKDPAGPPSGPSSLFFVRLWCIYWRQIHTPVCHDTLSRRHMANIIGYSLCWQWK